MEERQKVLNRDVIKYFAAFTMLLNHIAHVFLTPGTVLYEIFLNLGYFTAVTMCFFLAEGYGYTRSKEKYVYRLLVFAVISQVPYSMAFAEEGFMEFNGFNMIATLLLCFLIILTLDEVRNPSLRTGIVAGLILLSVCCDWPVLAPVFTILFVRAQDVWEERRDAYIKAAVFFGAVTFLGGLGRISIGRNLFQTFAGMAGIALSGIVILGFYNGRQMKCGRKFSKWFFYVFYPLHLLVIGIIRVVC